MDYGHLNDTLTKEEEKKFFVSVVPVSHLGEVLLGKRSEDGIWTTPGGGAEPGEEPHEAARRELFEEAGLAAGPNSLELVNVSETPRGFKIHSFLWRMPRELAGIATSKLDPDQEVNAWKLYHPKDFPGAMKEEKNAQRLKTIREALMHFYGLSKSMTSEQREAFNFWVTDPDSQGETVADLTDERLADLVAKLTKGGPGSGVIGHQTARKPTPSHPQVKAPPAPPMNKLQAHVKALKDGGVIPGLQTQSGKPIVTDLDQARALGFTEQDHVDALNAHHQLAMKTQAMLDKLKMAGRKPPKEGVDIAKFHEKKMKEHMRARDYLEVRGRHTAEAVKNKPSVKKSTTQMGGGMGDRDLATGDFAQSNAQASTEWMERLYQGTSHLEFGDMPIEFVTDRGTLFLAKVDDGLYSGTFTKRDVDGLEDNVRVRIERTTIPELVQFMIAKEWISNHVVQPVVAPEPAPQPDLTPTTPEPQLVAIVPQVQVAQAVPAVPAPAPLNRAEEVLELIYKLLS